MTDSNSSSEIQDDTTNIPDRKSAGRVRLAGLAAAALALALTSVWDSESLRESVFDRFQSHAPRAIDKHHARIVRIDNESLKKHGQWPWPRHLLAELTQGIHARGALAIGFDMIFVEPDRHAPENLSKAYPGLPDHVHEAIAGHDHPDTIFEKTISRLPVVLARSGHHDEDIDHERHPKNIPIEAGFKGHPPPDGLPSFGNVRTNLPKLDAAAAGHAVLHGSPDKDGVVRRVPLLVKIGGRPTPTLALETLRVAANADDYHLETEGDRLVAITLGRQRIPTDPDGAVRLHFSETQPETNYTVSAAAILDGSAPKAAFRGSVVFVGATATGLPDIVATPTAGEVFGVELHAQLVDIILSGKWLQRHHHAHYMEAAVAILLGLLAIVVLPLLRPIYVIVAGGLGVIALMAGSFAIFLAHGMLFDPLAPSMVGGATVLSMACMMFLEADRRRRELRDALVEERVVSAKIAGEMEAAREIQMGMLPGPEALAALPPQVDLMAVLEPAQSIGGDLYDAFLVEGDRLFFMIGDVTGKGVPASLFMALSKALTRSAVLRGADEFENAVLTANLEISRENTADMFVTGILGLIDLNSGEMALVNAGHDDPVILRANEPPEQLRLEGGPLLCVMDDFPYPVEAATLVPGDIMVLTTDGVTEARDPEGNLFGHDRLMETLAGIDLPETADVTVSAVVTSVRSFEDGGAASDDLTVMAVRYVGETQTS